MAAIPDLSNTSLAAQKLLGCYLIRKLGHQNLVGKIVETEAYLGQGDITSHSYRGRTARNSVMFGPPGVAYIYFTYGMHYCFNVVSGKPAKGEAVLIRALEPVAGIKQMQSRRQQPDVKNLCSGPAKLCQALAIDKQLNGHKLTSPPLWLEPGEAVSNSDIVTTTRVGVSEVKPLNLRFYLKNNDYISHA